MTSCSSLRLFFTTKIPNFKTTRTTTQNPTKTLRFLRPITFDRIAITNPPPLKSSPQAPSSLSDLQSIEDLPPNLRDTVRLFQSVQEPKAKYEQLLFYGKNLKPLSDRFKTKENRVEGCVSQVWVRAFLDSERNVVFEADSDSVLTKGLAALLVNGLSGRPVDEVLRVSPDFVVLLGLQQSLTPSRNNGFLNMLKLMQKKALGLLMEAESSSLGDNRSEIESNSEESKSLGENPSESESNSAESLSLEENSSQIESNSEESSSLGENPSEIKSNSDERLSLEENPSGTESNLDESSGLGEKSSSVGELGSMGLGRRGMRIREKLSVELRPMELEVEDVSYQHAGHAGARGSGDGETHFNVRVVSKEFEGKSLVKRHRLVYGLMEEELQSGLHALSIVAKTPQEVS